MVNKLIYLFPTVVLYKENILDNDELTELKKNSNLILDKTNTGGSNWYSKVKNTFNTYNVINDNNFDTVLKKITETVNYFNKENGSSYLYGKPLSGWLNYYEVGDYQEFHNHATHRYSAIYIVKGEKDKGTTVSFNNPYQDMLPPIDVKHNDLTYQSYNLKPVENSLLIFRSHLQHCVHKHESLTPRITLACNFN